MNVADFQVLVAAGLILLMVLAPVFAWPETRKLTLPVLGFYVLFLFLHGDFVFGNTGTDHDTFWNWQGWSIIIQQWLQSDASLGWNPYWGAGQPFALYNNIFCYLPTIAFFHFFNLLGLNLPPSIFFNLIFIFGYLNICTASLLLFRLLYKNNYICLFGFTTMLLGGLFFTEIYQGGLYILGLFPYLLFLLIYFYKTKNPAALVFCSLIAGLAVNFYLPTYIFVSLLMFLLISLLAGLTRPRRLQEEGAACLKGIASKPGMILLGLVLFFSMAAPFITNYMEMRDFVSPTRGFAAEAQSTRLSYQDSVNVPLSRYSYLFDYETDRNNPPEEEFLIKTHGAFYIGMLPFLGLFIALFFRGNWIFTALGAMLVLISAGHATPVWGWMMEYVPLVDITRHTFMFARAATFALVAASLGGFMALISDKYSLTRKLSSIIFAATVLFFLMPKELSGLQMANLLIAVIALILISLKWSTLQPRALPICLVVFIALHTTLLLLFSAHQQMPPAKQFGAKAIEYPGKWEVFPREARGLPLDHSSLFNKQAIWSHRIPNYIFMLQKDFARFLLRNNFLIKFNPGGMGFQKTPAALALKDAVGPIFNMVPYREGITPDQTSLQALKQIAGIQKPVLNVAGGSSGETSLLAVLDSDLATSWKIEPHANFWISFSIQEGFDSNRLEIWLAPGTHTDQEDFIELWLSEDSHSWTLAQKLELEKSTVGTTPILLKYVLAKSITQGTFKLVFNNKHPMLLSEINLIETPSISPDSARGGPMDLPMNSRKVGVVRQNPSTNPNKVELDVSAKSDAYILRLENYHPDWLAFIDGEEVPILRVYPNFQMVFVPAGEHKITFEFQSIYYSLVILNIVTGFLGGAAFLLWLAGFNITVIWNRFNLQKLFPSKRPVE